METKITQWLQSHRHSEYFKAQMLANTEYTEIAEYVEATPRCFVIEQALDGGPERAKMAELQADYKAFLQEFAIDDIKAYRERKQFIYAKFRVTKQGINDIIDYCVLYGLTQQETSRLLDSAIHLVEDNTTFNRPSKRAFALTLLWVQVWQCRVFTHPLRAKFEAHGFNTNATDGTSFKEFNRAFAVEVERVKSEHYGK